MIPGIDLLAVPLGYILWFFYSFIGNYFLSIFLFTLVVRAATFPLSLKSQKMQADRARLTPRLERLQKKYAKDKKKLQEKQMQLYEKEGVSLTGGCLPTIIQMIVLFGVIAVIYKPVSNLTRIPAEVLEASFSAVAQETKEGEDGKTVEVPDSNRLSESERSDKNIYRELRLLMVIDKNKQKVIDSISELSASARKNISAVEYYNQMDSLRRDFNFFGSTLLQNPWNEKGFAGINMLWIIAIISGLTAFASSLISIRYINAAQSTSGQPGQGCQNNAMLIVMPLFSLFITFRVPGAVGVYWISSNILALIQTIILNQIYNPAKIRAQAELEYQERRRQKLEDKKRLAQARARENAELNAANQAAAKGKKSKSKSSPKKPADVDRLKETDREKGAQQNAEDTAPKPETSESKDTRQEE